MRKILFSALLLSAYMSAFAQQNQPVEMADVMRNSGKIYVVIAIVVIIFTGLAIYLFSIDRRLKKIEKEK
jgi:CcmD family protein